MEKFDHPIEGGYLLCALDFLSLIILLLVLVIGSSACTIHNGDGGDENMKNSTTRLKEAPTVRSGLPLIILLLVLVIGSSACTIHNGDGAVSATQVL